MQLSKLFAGSLGVIALFGTPASASAFCGFYVAAEDGPLYGDATQVVLMREGTTTVLSMQNAYRGPVEDFAMVVPVPVVLSEADVKTLPHEVFERVDRLSSPRLVEYWEQDPCAVGAHMRMDAFGALGALTGSMGSNAALQDLLEQRVRVEAEFAVGEYDIVILGADDSSALERWLVEHGYRIPEGAGDVLRPYVSRGMKFFVAKVDAARVRFESGRAVLSPLRFHYDEDRFQLPIRLGMLSSAGEQDLIVHVLARNARYEVANRENVFIPTNLRVADRTRRRFGPFYDGLFSEVRASHRDAVVTEYAWQAQGCDPCPGPVLSESDLETLGADVAVPEPGPYHGSFGGLMDFVLTRLHYRYTRDSLDEDLVFRRAEPMAGGREYPDGSRTRPVAAPVNAFQGRYIIRHRWAGPVECVSPQYGVWGEEPGASPWAAHAPDDQVGGPGARAGLTVPPRSVESDVPEPVVLRDLLLTAVPGFPSLDPTPDAAVESLPRAGQWGSAGSRSQPRAVRSGRGCAAAGTTAMGGLPLLLALCLARRRYSAASRS